VEFGFRSVDSATTKLSLNARAHDRILKISRTVADLAASDAITPEHVSEAIQYRTFDRTLWVLTDTPKTHLTHC
jgi:magnesium chelatase family protein